MDSKQIYRNLFTLFTNPGSDETLREMWEERGWSTKVEEKFLDLWRSLPQERRERFIERFVERGESYLIGLAGNLASEWGEHE